MDNSGYITRSIDGYPIFDTLQFAGLIPIQEVDTSRLHIPISNRSTFTENENFVNSSYQVRIVNIHYPFTKGHSIYTQQHLLLKELDKINNECNDFIRALYYNRSFIEHDDFKIVSYRNRLYPLNHHDFKFFIYDDKIALFNYKRDYQCFSKDPIEIQPFYDLNNTPYEYFITTIKEKSKLEQEIEDLQTIGYRS